MSGAKLTTPAEYEAQVRSGACYETGCPKPPAWVVSTAGGRLAFCAAHAGFYRRKGPDVYPVEPVAARPLTAEEGA